MKYDLKKPVTGIEDQPIGSLTFREEIVAGDLRDLKLQNLAEWTTGEVLRLAGRLCAQPDAVLNRLSVADLLEVQTLVLGFLMAGHQTGTASSPS